MADRLSMSLDQIIDQTQEFNKIRYNDVKNTVVKSSMRKERNVGKFVDNKKFHHFQKPHIVKDVPERPMKMITRERPKVITPDTVNTLLTNQTGKPNTQVATVTFNSNVPVVGPTSVVGTVTTTAKSGLSSVFNRLGSTGTYVLFSNLKRTVEEADIIELCRAVGEIKDVKLTVNFPGNNYARVLFAYERDATACVAKYNGLTLDGEEMRVVIDNVQSQVVPVVNNNVFSRIDTTAKFVPSVVALPPSNDANIRAGLFGTALQTGIVDDDEDENGGNNRGKRGQQRIVFQENLTRNNPPNPRKVQQVNATEDRRPRYNGERGQKGFQSRRPVRKSSTNNSNEAMTTEDLDNDLNQYLASR